jgi:hypothetical protein
MKRQFAVVTVLFALACQDSGTEPNTLAKAPPNASIIDGGFGGNSHFFWLNPQWTSRTFTGTVIQTLSPTVRVCRWSGTACIGADVAVFTRADGTVNVREEDYTAVWNTLTANAQLNELFRARVYLGELEIGARDLKFVTKSVFGTTPNDNFEWAPVHYDPNDAGSNRPSGKYTFRFRLEEGVLREALGLDGECNDCAEGSVSPNSTVTTVIETPNDDAAAVFAPGSVSEAINVLVEKLDVPCLPTDAQQYPACYRFVAVPDIEFTIPATVEVCIEEIDDFAVDQVQLYKVKERRVEGEWVPTGQVEALENVPDQFIDCGTPPVIGAIGRKYPHLARSLRVLTRPFAKVVGPRLAWASDEGRGGRTSEFSRIGWVRAVNIAKGTGDNQSGLVGGTLNPAVVHLSPVHFEHVEGTPAAAGVPVSYQILGPDNAAGPSGTATSNVDGVVSLPLTLGSEPGTYRLVVTAPGTNLADRNAETGELVGRAVPQVEFTLMATDPAPSIALVPLAQTIVINCIPFGQTSGFGDFQGFMYRNVPAFTLRPGDRIAFDMGSVNDQDIRRDVYFAFATPNPARPESNQSLVSQDLKAVAWKHVASESQLPLNPRGNTVVGDYELMWTAETRFVFPGGALVVGFAAPSGNDTTCDGQVVTTDAHDPADVFYGRFFDKSVVTADALDAGVSAESGATRLAGIRIFEPGSIIAKVAISTTQATASPFVTGASMVSSPVAGDVGIFTARPAVIK